MLLVYRNLMWNSGVTVTPSSETTDMDGDNLMAPHPTENWRATSVSSVYVGVELDPFQQHGPAWDVVAVLATNATPHRNGLAYANRLDQTAGWTRTNLDAPSYASVDPPVDGMIVWELTPTASGAAHLQQTVTKAQATNLVNTLIWWVQDKSDGTTTHVRLYMEGATGSDYAQADFNLTTGAVNGSASSGGTFSSPEASVVRSVGSMHLCRLQATSSASADIKQRIQALTTAFGTSLTTSNVLQAANPTLDPVGTATDEVINNGATTGSLWRLRSSFTDAVSSTDYDTSWLHLPRNADLRDRTSIHGWHRASTVKSHPSLRLDFHDPENADGVLDVGALYVGKAVNLASRVPHRRGIGATVEDTGGEVEARGGERYTTVQPTKTGVTARLIYMTEAEALGDIHAVERLRGRSEPILLIADETETDYGQELMAYGTLADLDVVEHTEAGWWGEVRLTVREMVPSS